MAATKLTEWPSLFPKPIKEAIALHFTLCESRSPKAGERLATEVYTPAGVLHGTRRIYAGSDGKPWLWSTSAFFLKLGCSANVVY